MARLLLQTETNVKEVELNVPKTSKSIAEELAQALKSMKNPPELDIGTKREKIIGEGVEAVLMLLPWMKSNTMDLDGMAVTVTNTKGPS